VTPEYGRTKWDRAIDALRDAEILLANGGFDGAVSRAYYAAFHAVTALFALEGRVFIKHAAVQAAVHRDLVKAGRWPADLGRAFSFCVDLRGPVHASAAFSDSTGRMTSRGFISRNRVQT
jgi:uncharacterized protein (UPF0332 family)